VKYFIGLCLALLVFACSAELPESGRSVTEKEAQPQDITINVNNINQNYLFDDPEKGFVDNLTLTDNVSISIVNSPTNTNTNTNNNCTIVDNSSDNASDNGSCTAFVLRVFRT
jgi:hypothetical protein